MTFSQWEAEAGKKVEAHTERERERERKGEREREEEESGGRTQRGKWCNKHFKLKSKGCLVQSRVQHSGRLSTLKLHESLPFKMEFDASDGAISVAFNQGGRPVAFMSKILQGSRLKYHIIEKEAIEIVKAVWKWSHYLTEQHFTLITDQRSVAFSFSNEKHSKIKKAKKWRLELSTLDYTIKYYLGNEKVVPDTLSRTYTCSLINSSTLVHLHNGLCDAGSMWLLRFEKKNLPFSMEDVKKVCFSCRICAQVKPHFYILPESTLIKVTRPMERLSIDFEGPVPSVTSNTYLLVVIDKYLWFPFVFPCPNMHTTLIIKALDRLFSLTGMPCYIHLDRGASFMSKELRDYLVQKGIVISKAMPYYPASNDLMALYRR